MGDAKKSSFRVQFNRRIKLEFHGAKVTSDAGLLLYRELDEVLGLTALGSENVVDDCTSKGNPPCQIYHLPDGEVAFSASQRGCRLNRDFQNL